jgi:hypothetical protein
MFQSALQGEKNPHPETEWGIIFLLVAKILKRYLTIFLSASNTVLGATTTLS